MEKYIIKIELKSDLCTHSGETYNSYVDTDVVYDSYGLPYIPAKRIKGCIREACLELKEFGKVTGEIYKSLFGEGGNCQTKFILGNAFLEKYDEYRKALSECTDMELKNPQNVLNVFTYVRTQTAINEDGSADDKSLRTIRVVKKGLCFKSELQFAGSKDEEAALKKAVSMVKHMGVARTRGLGLVSLSLESLDSPASPAESQQTSTDSEVSALELEDGIYKMRYSIHLKSPIICKSPQGNEAVTMDYIEGGKMLGRIIGLVSIEKLKHMDSLKVTNAYITNDDGRCVPISASLQKQKNQEYNDDGTIVVSDMLFQTEQCTDVQMTGIDFDYVSSNGLKAEVNTEINYHHRRPVDKSIGRALQTEDSDFYQLESICAGQTFSGFIYAEKKGDDNDVGAILHKKDELLNTRMGYGRSAEYGEVSITIEDPQRVCEKKKIVCKDFAVKLNAPMILYNDAGMPEASVELLCREVAAALSNNVKLERTGCYINTETIGGYNVTWQRPKPVLTVLGKGTICRFKAEEDVDVGCLQDCFLGERTSEGYGEIEIITDMSETVTLRNNKFAYLNASTEECPQSDIVQEQLENESEIIQKLRERQKKKEIQALARENADKMFEEIREEDEVQAVLSKLFLIAKNESDFKGMNEQVEDIKSNKKKKLSTKILEPIKNNKDYYSIYKSSYLHELKYKLRKDGGMTDEQNSEENSI